MGKSNDNNGYIDTLYQLYGDVVTGAGKQVKSTRSDFEQKLRTNPAYADFIYTTLKDKAGDRSEYDSQLGLKKKEPTGREIVAQQEQQRKEEGVSGSGGSDGTKSQSDEVPENGVTQRIKLAAEQQKSEAGVEKDLSSSRKFYTRKEILEAEKLYGSDSPSVEKMRQHNIDANYNPPQWNKYLSEDENLKLWDAQEDLKNAQADLEQYTSTATQYADKINPIEEKKRQNVFAQQEIVDALQTKANFRDNDNYVGLYDIATMKPMAISKQELPDFLNQFIKEELQSRDEFQGKKFEDLTPDQQRVVWYNFSSKYVEKSNLQKYLADNNYNVNLEAVPHAGAQLAKGALGTFASMIDGIGVTNRQAEADVINDLYLKAKLGVITKKEYEAGLKTIMDDMRSSINTTTHTYSTNQGKEFPGYKPTGYGPDGPGGFKAAIYSEADLEKMLGNLPTFEDIVNKGAKQPFADNKLTEFASELEKAGSLLSSNPKFNKNWALTTVPQALGSTGAFAITALGGGITQPLRVAVSGGLASASSGYRDAIAKGGSARDAEISYLVNFGLGTTEAIPIVDWLGRLKRITGNSLLVEAMLQGSEEMIQESVQGVGSNLTAKMLYDEARKINEGVFEGGTAGFASGFIMTMAGYAIQYGANLSKEDKALLEETRKILEPVLENNYTINRDDQKITEPEQTSTKSEDVKKDEVVPPPVEEVKTDEKPAETDDIKSVVGKSVKIGEYSYNVTEVRGPFEVEEGRSHGNLKDVKEYYTIIEGKGERIKASHVYKNDKGEWESLYTDDDSILEVGEVYSKPEPKSSTKKTPETTDVDDEEIVETTETDYKKKSIDIIDSDSSALSDLLEHVDEPFSINSERLNLLDKQIDAAKKKLKASPKNAERKKELEALQAEKADLDNTIYQQQADSNTGLVEGVKKLADEIGVDLSNESDEDINENIIQYMVDGRYMENVYTKMTAKEYTTELIKDYAGVNKSGDGKTGLTSEMDGNRLIDFKKGDVVYRNYNGRYEEYVISKTNTDIWTLHDKEGSPSKWNANNNGGFILKEKSTKTPIEEIQDLFKEGVKKSGAPEGNVIIGSIEKPNKISNQDIKKGDTVYDKNGSAEILRVFKAPKGSAQEGKTLVDIKRENGKKAINMPIENFSKNKPEDSNSVAVNGFDNLKAVVPQNIKGKFLSASEADELQKEIESNYINGDPNKLLAGKTQDIRQNIFNYDEPLYQKTINGVDVRITSGLVENIGTKDAKNTYYTYADGKIFGVFYSSEDAEAAIDFLSQFLVKEVGSGEKNVEKTTVSKKIKGRIKKIENSELDDLWKDFSDSMTVNVLLNPEQLGKALKIIAKYTELGTLKFVDIVLDATARLGEDKVKPLIDALKQAYGSFRETAPDDIYDQLSTSAEVRAFNFDEYFSDSPTEIPDITEKQAFIGSFRNQLMYEGKRFDIRSIRKLAESTGLKEAKDTTLQEYVELGIYEVARTIANRNVSDYEKLEQLINLYNIQPTISMRSSERIDKQQYSTPIPIAFSAGMFVGHEQSIFEPSAGNGLLTIYFDPSTVTVNEIDPVRLENLNELGFNEVTNLDATKPFPGEKFDGLIMNPPFGSSAAIDVDGYKISGLDEQMIVNALKKLKPNGHAAIIMGGHNSYDELGRLKADRTFFNYLYNHYNVADVINIDGKLYQKQGTTFPIRLILISGVKSEPKGAAPLFDKMRDEVVSDFKSLFNRIKADYESVLQPNMDDQSNTGDDFSGGNTGGIESNEQTIDNTVSTGKTEKTNKGGSGTKRTSGKSDRGLPGDGTQSTSRTDSGGNEGISDAERQVYEMDESFSEGTGGPGGSDESGSGGTDVESNDTVSVSRKFDIADLTKQKIKYYPKSKGFSVDTVIPTAMAVETEKTLQSISEFYGGVDSYVKNKLRYRNLEELYNAFSGEQIDGIAISINQIENGYGAIIGDMTGVGKGRIAAGVVRYAVKNGYKPIFMSERPNLFSDLYRDMLAIGSSDLVPFIVNDKSKDNDPTITDEEGVVVYKLLPSSSKRTIFESAVLPKNYDYVMATYTQFRSSPDKPSIKKDFLLNFSRGNVLILDESHNVSGDSNSGAFFQEVILGSKGVNFLSATFAKRPDNMPVYAMKTSMQDANMTTDELISAIVRGGVALQEVVSAQLVESGQMIRRERSFEGVDINYDVLSELEQQHSVIADGITSIIRDIINFQRTHVDPIIKGMDKEVAAEGGSTGGRKGTSMAGVDNTAFASKVFNIIDQLLFSIKSTEVANAAVELVKQNKKPVIVFKNTMGSFLEALGYNPGDVIEKLDFAITLNRGLEGTLRYTEITAGGDKIHKTLSITDLSPEAIEDYNRIRGVISKGSEGITLSPIDSMKKILFDAGLTVGEITGRDLYVEFQDDGTGVVKERIEKDLKKTSRDFNSGKLDVIMLNAAGATGISLHASKTFKDQRQRVMINSQLQLDINKEIQARGRIDRTGQVVRGAYNYVVTSIPAESRMLMMFKAKLKSLDANTTSSQKSKQSEVDVVDFLNKYGDQVVLQYLAENQEMNDMLLDPLKLNSKSEDFKTEQAAPEGAARMVTGRVAILPTKDQKIFYDEVLQRYLKYLEYLESNNENDLEVKILPLNAEVKGTKTIIVGKGTGTPFGSDSTLETTEVDVLKKPMKIDEIKKRIIELYPGVNPSSVNNSLVTESETYFAELTIKNELEIRDEYATKIQNAYQLVDKEAARKGNVLTGPERELAIEEKISELEDARNSRIERMKNKNSNYKSYIQDLLSYFKIGAAYQIPVGTKEETSKSFTPGLLMQIEIGSAKYKFTPSNISLKFAVADGRRMVIVPASKISLINSVIAQSALTPITKELIDNWDNQLNDKPRAIRYIITGNILQAYGTNDGQLVSYTTKDGQLKKGLLLPEYYKPGDQLIRIPINKAAKYILNNPFVRTIDSEILISKEKGGNLSIEVPLSRVSGGKYFLDNDLRGLIIGNDFKQVGMKMTGIIKPENLQKVLDLLQSKHSPSIDVDSAEYEMLTKEPTDDDTIGKKTSKATAKIEKTRYVADEVIRRLGLAFPNVKVNLLSNDDYKAASAAAIIKQKFGEPVEIGFFDPETGEITLNRDNIVPGAAIEEFAHLWLHILKNVNNSLYKKGEAMAKAHPMFEQLKSDEGYMDIWNDDDSLANETMAKLIRDEALLELADKTWYQSFKNWLSEMWNSVKGILRKVGINLDQVDINRITLEDIVDGATSDLLRTTPVTYMTSEQIAKLADVESPIFIDDQLNSNLLNPKSDLIYDKYIRANFKKNFLLYRGASKRLGEIYQQSKFNINAHRHGIGLVMKDFQQAVKRYSSNLGLTGEAKNEYISTVLQNVNKYLHGEFDLDALPEELRVVSKKVRENIDSLTRDIMENRIALDDDIVYGINERLELYLQDNFTLIKFYDDKINAISKDLKVEHEEIANMDLEQLAVKEDTIRKELAKNREFLRQRKLKTIQAAILKQEFSKTKPIAPELKREIERIQGLLTQIQPSQATNRMIPLSKEEKALNKKIVDALEELKAITQLPRTFTDEEVLLMEDLNVLHDLLNDGIISTRPGNLAETRKYVQKLSSKLAKRREWVLNEEKMDNAVEEIGYKQTDEPGKFDLTFIHVNGTKTEFWMVPIKDIETLFGESISRKVLRDGNGFHKISPVILENNKLFAKMMANMGKYITRSYMLHDQPSFSKKWAKVIENPESAESKEFLRLLGPETYREGFHYIKSQYQDSRIHSIKVIATPDGKYSVKFRNKYGIESEELVVKNLERLMISNNGVMSSNDIKLLKNMLTANEGIASMSLSKPTGNQSFARFKMSREAVNNIIMKIVTKDGFKSIYSGLPVDGFDGSIFKKKGDIADPIRAIMGEYTDPFMNATKTLLKMSTALENGRLVQQMIDEGPGIFLSDRQTQFHTVKITKEDLYSLGDRVYYITPEVYDLLLSDKKAANHHWFWDLWIGMSGMAKAANTIYFPESQARNFFGAALNMIATGNVNFTDLRYAISVSSQDMNSVQGYGTFMSTPLFVLRGIAGNSFGYFGKGGTGIYDKENLRNTFLEASKYGVINENLDVNVINDLHHLMSDNKVKEMYANATDAFAKPYQLTDNVFKVAQWINEQRTLSKAYPEMSEETVMKKAADIVRRTAPTYSELPDAFKHLARFPVMASFVMFTSSMVKTRVEIIRQISKEFKSGNPVLMAKASKRSAGLISTMMMGYALYRVFAYLYDWDDDENEAVNALSPSYAQNNLRLYLSGDKKMTEFVDLTYIDPSSLFYKSIIAFNREDGNILSKTKEAITEFSTPYTSVDIFTQSLIEVIRNEDQAGFNIYNKSDTETEKTRKIIGNMLQTVIPRFVDSYNRLYMAATGKENDWLNENILGVNYNKVYELDNELENLTIGAKARVIDEGKSAKRKVRAAYENIQEPPQLYKKKELTLDEANERANKYFDEIILYTEALKTLGFSNEEIYGNFVVKRGKLVRDGGILDEAGLPAYLIEQIADNKFLGVDESGENNFKGN